MVKKITKDKVNGINKILSGLINNVFELGLFFISVYKLLFILFTGACSAILLYKLFPETFIYIFSIASILIIPLGKILCILIAVLTSLCIAYFIYNLAEYFFNLIDKSNKRVKLKQEKRKNKFIKELVKELNEGKKR